MTIFFCWEEGAIIKYPSETTSLNKNNYIYWRYLFIYIHFNIINVIVMQYSCIPGRLSVIHIHYIVLCTTQIELHEHKTTLNQCYIGIYIYIYKLKGGRESKRSFWVPAAWKLRYFDISYILIRFKVWTKWIDRIKTITN